MCFPSAGASAQGCLHGRLDAADADTWIGWQPGDDSALAEEAEASELASAKRA